ncbi:MAG: RNA methyltransferase [Saprospiraceae bacterium]|nr:RNA methyltransferase [Saprospiraceae bacterium]
MSNRVKHFREVYPDVASVIAQIKTNRHPISVLLDGIQDVQNIGAILRLADAARLEQVILFNHYGETPAKKLSRVSRSTDQYVNFHTLSSWDALLALKETHTLVALEITTNSVPYFDWQPQFPLLLMAGGEQQGISESVLALADQVVHLPMYGVNLSMNVAMASSIVVYHWLQYVALHE